jgi:hypothetical protein
MQLPRRTERKKGISVKAMTGTKVQNFDERS